MLETQTLSEYNGDIELVFIELPKFTALQTELQALQDQWIYFIKNAGSLQMIPSELGATPDLKKAFELVNEANMSPSELEAQHKRKEFIMIQRTAIEKATDDGLAQGIALRNREIAVSLLDVLDDAAIAKATGLSLSDVASLRQ